MGVSYVEQKCPSCAGTKFSYDKAAKIWKCLYCDTTIERHEQIDTMFTIKNVVRQAILDAACDRMPNAQNNLVECKKIDSKYIGTVIAETVYQVNMILNGKLSKSEQQNYFSMLKKNYMTLKSFGAQPTEEEMALYEFFESSEVVGALILTFDFLNEKTRIEALLPFFDASAVYSMELNKKLLRYAVQNGRYEMLDAILHNTDNINKKAVLGIVLEKYPDSPKKAENAAFLIKNEPSFEEEDRKKYETYLSDSSDSAETKYAVARALCSTPARPSTRCIMQNVISNLSDTQAVSELMEALMKNELLDIEIETIMSYSLQSCEDEVCLENIRMLKETGKYVELTPAHFKAVFDRRSDNTENKKAMIGALMEFGINDKLKDRIIGEYLCESVDTPENRSDMLDYLLSLTENLSPNTIEKYLLKSTADKEQKALIVKKIFSAVKINVSFFRQTLSNYILNAADAFSVKKEVVYTLLEAGLTVNAAACMKMLFAGDLNPQEKIELLRRAKAVGVSYDDVMEQYVQKIDAAQFDSELFSELLQGASSVSVACIKKYVLELKDLSAAKVGNIGKMTRMSYSRPSVMTCNIKSGGVSVVCNLIQAYILTTNDSPELADGVFEALGGDRNAAGQDIEAGGTRWKFKKYVAAKNKEGSLTEAAQTLCRQCRIL